MNVELKSNLTNNGLLKNQFFYTNYNFELYSNFTFFKEDSINGDQIRQKENRNLYGYNLSYQKSNHIKYIKIETKTGVQIRLDNIKNIELTRTKNRETNINAIMNGDIIENNSALYLSESFLLKEKFEITSGLRFDYFINNYTDKLNTKNLTTTSLTLSPKLNFNYNISKKVQLYLMNGKGFHSNDTRVAVQQNGLQVLPSSYGSDFGGVFKLGNKTIIQTALWFLWLDQEFIYVGDEGVIEPGGKTKRYGADFSLRQETFENLFIDLDLSYANPKLIGVTKKESYIPLAPTFTSIGGITYKKNNGISASVRYRYMANRAANETNSVIAKGYFLVDASINYKRKNWEIGCAIQNLLNTKWKETQFDTSSKLKNETEAVSEIHFTPGTPFFSRLNFSYYF